ncbi:hypothetical protein INT45_001390 [Circinella minor]|uniref:Uncharacterized protein n=1 Tax=Circinella minor TaxID=1195481 RepID=A0A8H7VCC8_9FUNG|nr:hypothetical protein INT45_001390 [Circinella minor]
MRYLPLSQLLGSMLAFPSYRAMFRETFNNRRTTESLTDIFDGFAFEDQERYFNDEFSVGLALFCDSFAPFDAGRNSVSMQLIHLVVMNLPKDERYKNKNMLQVPIALGPLKPKNIHSFLSPLMEELDQLSKDGMVLRVDDEPDDIMIHAHLLLASGDLPGVSDLVHHTGHTSHYGCRTCRIESFSLISPKGGGQGQYFPGTEEVVTERNDDDFFGRLPNYGILASNPFVHLVTYHSPFFYGQHANANTPFTLERHQQIRIGKVLKESHLLMPIGLDGDIGDIFARSKSSRAVDFIDFLVFVLPTVVYEQLEQNGCPVLEPLMSLVNGCSLALQWEITYNPEPPEREGDSQQPSDLDRLRRYLKEWHTFMYNDMPHNLYIINIHMLTHLADAIGVLGIPRAISTRSIERAIAMI